MRDVVKLYTSQDSAQMEAAAEVLKPVLAGLSLHLVTSTQTMEGRLPLPFLETPSGERFFGVAGIRRYVERTLTKRGP